MTEPAATGMPFPLDDCSHCPRLADFRRENRDRHPDYFNNPVPSFSASRSSVRLLIVGLAPGLKGANRTGRPFTGDDAGDLLFSTLIKFGWARGTYDRRPDDGVQLVACRITNAVRCVPPQNKPIGSEVNECNGYLRAEIGSLPALETILCLGRLSHDAVLKALGERKSAWPFAHNARHRLADGRIIVDSYHCSRYNTNTRRLTPTMFEEVFAALA